MHDTLQDFDALEAEYHQHFALVAHCNYPKSSRVTSMTSLALHPACDALTIH